MSKEIIFALMLLAKTHDIDSTHGYDLNSWYSHVISKDSWYRHGLIVLTRTHGIDIDSW